MKIKGDLQSIKLQIPGWTGEATHETPQPWHFKEFVDTATYGIELFYSFEKEVKITTLQQKVQFHYDGSWKQGKFPFNSSSPFGFSYRSNIDIQTEPGFNMMILPHPRFYTDKKGNVPIAVSEQIETDWWIGNFIINFKLPNQECIFQQGDGIAQIILVPREMNATQMSIEETIKRKQLKQIMDQYDYKTLNNYNKKEQLNNLIEKTAKNILLEEQIKKNERRTKMQRWLFL